ncbi:15109_t:CDS:1, partial [Dentiscutata erythropus]
LEECVRKECDRKVVRECWESVCIREVSKKDSIVEEVVTFREGFAGK